MLRKVLIANRGEIACRIIRTCKEMGFATVAVYSDADSDALHLELADEAYYIGASEPSESYLNAQKILDAAHSTGSDAIHPGYGFLAENATFAYLVNASGLRFIGPPPETIEAMGDKRVAKLILQDVPLVPGYTGDDQSDGAFMKAASKIGYPIMIKATAGGGGKGMRQVDDPAKLAESLAAARREAKSAFGDDRLMLEKALPFPRHIEIQIFGDMYGNVIALGERECSIQRRHQKIIEETPSTAVDANLRRKMSDVAISIGKQLGYYSAGTVEFLLDDDGQFYFMEMNTRLQVEHPVTEMVYGVDLVRWQMQIARGVSLSRLLPPDTDLSQYYPEPSGHAVEVRVYAEDPANDFLPVTGKVLHWQEPDYVRVDSGIRSGDTISPYYDPMIAKIIAHDNTRTETLRKLDYALSRTILAGLRHNIAFLRRVLMRDEQLAGFINTRFLEEFPDLVEDKEDMPHFVPIAASLARQRMQTHWRNNPNRAVEQRFRHKDTTIHVQLIPERNGSFQVLVNNIPYIVTIHQIRDNHLILRLNQHQYRATVIHDEAETWWVHTTDGIFALRWLSPLPLPGASAESEASLRSPMPGQIIRIDVEIGQQVQRGDLLMIVEAMKMEHRIEAPYDGRVESLQYDVGDAVQQDAVLLDLIHDEPDA